MIAFPSMLVRPAEKAGIKVPPDPDEYGSDSYRESYPHFFVFATVQLGSSMPWPSAAWENAELIAGIPDERIKEVTYAELLEAGLAVGDTVR